MSLGAAECVASTYASQLGGGLRGTGVPRSVRPSHTSMTPNGQSRMCWRSPKIQTHVLTITKNTNQSVCYNAVTALTERFCQNVVGHPPGLRPPDNFRASGAQTAAVPQVSTLELPPLCLRATLRFKDRFCHA